MKKPDNVTQFRKRPIKSSKWKRSNRVPLSIRASSLLNSSFRPRRPWWSPRRFPFWFLLAVLIVLWYDFDYSFDENWKILKATFLDYDCIAFQTQAEAQKFFLDAGATDPHLLDADKDGLACEHLP